MASPKPSQPSSDRVVRLQLFLAFVVPLLLLGLWLNAKGFFSTP